MKTIASPYGLDAVVFFITATCECFARHVQCGFCNLQYASTALRAKKESASIQEMVETRAAAIGEGIRFVNLIGGSFLDHDSEFSGYLELAEAMSHEGDGPLSTFTTIISMPPQNLRLIEKTHSAGVQSLKFCIEVFDSEAFPRVMPGKARYGRDRILEALRVAVGVLGVNRVFSNMLVEIESAGTLYEGFEVLTSMGVVPVAKVFHPDIGSAMNEWAAPTPDMVMEASRVLHGLMRKRQLRPWLSAASLRGSLAWEFERGYIS